MISLTPSHIIEYLFCPRYTYYEYVLRIPQNEEKYYKVMRGREMHTEKLERNKAYLRKKIGVIDKHLDQYLTIENLRGIIDEVLELKDGSLAPLDYKFAEFKDRIYDTYKQQLICYAILIERNFHKPVHRGYLVYTRSNNKLIEIEITESDKKLVEDSIAQMIKIISNNMYPKATNYKKRCVNCTYRNICIK